MPERGGLITGWRCQGQELFYLDAERLADQGLSVRGGMPVLFPICGGLPDDRLPLPQGDFQLPQHGFARDLPWQLEVLSDGRGIAMELRDSPATRAAYPFAFRLRLEARLATAALEITVTVTHGGPDPSTHAGGDTPASGGGEAAETMPFSFGLHPYFAVSSLENAVLEGLPPSCFDHRTMAQAATDSQLPRLAQGIDLLTRPQETPVSLLDRGNGRRIELQTSPPWDLVVLWSEPPRPMVCLEPWTGPRQALISGDRRLELAAGSSLELHSRFRLLESGD